MKKMSFLVSMLLLSLTVQASDHHHHHHEKGPGSHEHGAIKLEIAVEGKTIEIDIDGPAESFIGFEYVPKTEKEKKVFSAAQSLWTQDLLTKLFILDQNLGCSATEVSFKQEVEEKKSKKETGVHSDIEAKAKITCSLDLKGLPMIVAVKKYFPKIKKLTIDLIGSETKSINAKASENIKL